jgi:hypothetical protein
MDEAQRIRLQVTEYFICVLHTVIIAVVESSCVFPRREQCHRTDNCQYTSQSRLNHNFNILG